MISRTIGNNNVEQRYIEASDLENCLSQKELEEIGDLDDLIIGRVRLNNNYPNTKSEILTTMFKMDVNVLEEADSILTKMDEIENAITIDGKEQMRELCIILLQSMSFLNSTIANMQNILNVMEARGKDLPHYSSEKEKDVINNLRNIVAIITTVVEIQAVVTTATDDGETLIGLLNTFKFRFEEDIQKLYKRSCVVRCGNLVLQNYPVLRKALLKINKPKNRYTSSYVPFSFKKFNYN